ncbi:MAG: hypothetical protein K6L76_03070 [Agarilytica sp.]
MKYLIVIALFMAGSAFAEQSSKKNIPDEATLYLESTLMGDKEQPTVSYFIPWKSTGTPDDLHWNLEQKNDKTLDLIDRDVMVRSMSIYNELNMENIPVAQ